MSDITAAALAAILDPERKVPGWWRERYFIADAEIPMCPREFVYIGPPDLHTAREHCWRMEEWLEAHTKRTYTWRRFVDFKDKYKTIVFDDGAIFTEDYNHAAALNAAIERIHNEVR